MKHLLLLLALTFIFNSSHAQKLIPEFELNTLNTSNNISPILNGVNLTVDRQQRDNHSYKFNGINDFIEIPTGLLNLMIDESLSMEMVIKLEKNKGTWIDYFGNEQSFEGGTIFSLYGYADTTQLNRPDLLLISYTNEGTITVEHRSQDGEYHILSFNSKRRMLGKYLHLVFVRNGETKNLSLYINGRKKAEVKARQIGAIGDFPTHIGMHRPVPYGQNFLPNVKDTKFLKGKMDFLRIYKIAKSDREIKKLYKKAKKTCYRTDYFEKDSKDKEYDEGKIDGDLSVYPNPARNNIFIKSNSEMDCREIRIINHCGQIVLRSTFKNQLHVGCLRPGFYTVVFLTPNKNFHRRLIVTR